LGEDGTFPRVIRLEIETKAVQVLSEMNRRTVAKQNSQSAMTLAHAFPR